MVSVNTIDSKIDSRGQTVSLNRLYIFSIFIRYYHHFIILPFIEIKIFEKNNSSRKILFLKAYVEFCYQI